MRAYIYIWIAEPDRAMPARKMSLLAPLTMVAAGPYALHPSSRLTINLEVPFFS